MPRLDLVIRNGTVITAVDEFVADIGIADGKIAALGSNLDASHSLDAQGMYVLPGLIDAHVHMQLPVNGMVSADDFFSGTVAAACGGVTTIIDFVTPQRGQPLEQAVLARRAEADGRAVVDYGLHLTAIDASRQTLDALPDLLAQGYSTLKMYTTYEAVRVDDGEMLSLMQACRTHGLLPLVHAENHHAIAHLSERLIAQGQTGPQHHPHSRPPLVEAEAVYRVLTLAGLVDVPVYLVHLSCAESLAHVQAARQRGQRVYAEVCAPHLLLDEAAYLRPGFSAADWVLSPPLRPAADQAALWQALAQGVLDVVSTDHCPWTAEQRQRGRDCFTQIPNGLAGVETRLPLMFDRGVSPGRISLTRLVETCAAAPARLMGLYPRKGTIAIGSDADLVLFDPTQAWTLDAARLHQRTDRCPYQGWQGQGWAHTVLLRGQVIVSHGHWLGQAGQGLFLDRHSVTP